MSLRSIRQIKNLKNKRVLVRVDFNVPIKKGKVTEDARLKASLPTIEFLMNKGAQVILVTHVGRPEGKVVKELSVKPISKRLGVLLGKAVKMVKMESRIRNQESGDVVLLENIRF